MRLSSLGRLVKSWNCEKSWRRKETRWRRPNLMEVQPPTWKAPRTKTKSASFTEIFLKGLLYSVWLYDHERIILLKCNPLNSPLHSLHSHQQILISFRPVFLTNFYCWRSANPCGYFSEVEFSILAHPLFHSTFLLRKTLPWSTF